VAASCSQQDKCVLVWDTATETVSRKLDITKSEDGRMSPQKVAVSRSGDWIVCAIELENSAYLISLWGPSIQEFTAHIQFDRFIRLGVPGVTINTSSQGRLRG
jgi:hypothetical protein